MMMGKTAGKLVRPGNTKLGKNVWQVSLLPGAAWTCPGESDCGTWCYAKTGFFKMTNVDAALRRDTELLIKTPRKYEQQLVTELGRLKDGSVVRIHVAGDFKDANHVRLWRRTARKFPALTFFAFTRSWRIGAMEKVLHELHDEPNVWLWGSTDDSIAEPLPGWLREAKVYDTEQDAREDRFAVCPYEQKPKRRKSCSECGLCWRAKDTAKLAFLKH